MRVQGYQDRVLKRRKLNRLEDFKRSDGPLWYSAAYVSMHMSKPPGLGKELSTRIRDKNAWYSHLAKMKDLKIHIARSCVSTGK